MINATIWTFEDAASGLCAVEDIGEAKPAIAPATLPAPEPVQTDWTEDIYQIEMTAYRRNPDAYRSSNASNLNKLLDIAARKAESLNDARLPEIATITKEQLANLSLADLKEMTVRYMYANLDADRKVELVDALNQPKPHWRRRTLP